MASEFSQMSESDFWGDPEAVRAAQIQYFFEDIPCVVKEAGDAALPRHLAFEAIKIYIDGRVTKDKSSSRPGLAEKIAMWEQLEKTLQREVAELNKLLEME